MFPQNWGAFGKHFGGFTKFGKKTFYRRRTISRSICGKNFFKKAFLCLKQLYAEVFSPGQSFVAKVLTFSEGLGGDNHQPPMSEKMGVFNPRK